MDMPFGLGAQIPRPSDVRDYSIGRSQAPVQLPAVYMPDHSNLPVKFQGKYGSCGGHAGGAFVSFTYGVDLAPKFTWKYMKQIYDAASGTLPSSDTGVDIRSLFKALQQYGTCHEATCPDILDPTFEQYSDTSTLTDTMKNEAAPYGVNNYAFTDNPTWDQIRQAIFQNGAAVLAVDCGDGWWMAQNGQASYKKSDIMPLRLGNYVDGHFILAWGYDQNYIYFRNSWGSTWASTLGNNDDGGDGYFGRDYIGHVKEMGVALDAPSTQQQLVTLYQKLVYALQQLLAAMLKGRITNQSQ